jgi:hypothetical protein
MEKKRETKEHKENIRLRRILSECITIPGALCYSGSNSENYRNMTARLNYISEIASYAVNYKEK